MPPSIQIIQAPMGLDLKRFSTKIKDVLHRVIRLNANGRNASMKLASKKLFKLRVNF
jgi:hypothetical protein